MGVMQLMPDKFRPGDDPFRVGTNLQRAAEHIAQLQARYSAREQVAAAYFGAVDRAGNITGASDGNVDGFEYVRRFEAAVACVRAGADLPSGAVGALVSPIGFPITPANISFGFLDDYGPALAWTIRGADVERYGTRHLAWDLIIPGAPANGRGYPVFAPMAGRIIRTSDPVGGPNGIWIENSSLNLRARLMHMDGLVEGIETGVAVKAGQQLGILGAQGTEGFPHLHLAFERLSDGARINPALFYRLRDPTDPATLVGTWFDSLPGTLPAVPRPRPSPHLGPETFPRPGVTRWGPFELPEP
jgi:murein DD-endopeptidase MepM/ murein hydrolase activator NlpD